jgi:hypothetical protein
VLSVLGRHNSNKRQAQDPPHDIHRSALDGAYRTTQFALLISVAVHQAALASMSMTDYLLIVCMSAMRRVLLIFAAGAYAVFLVRATLPTLSIYYDFTAYLFMVGSAAIATVCVRGAQRWFTWIALVFAVAAAIYTGQLQCRAASEDAGPFPHSSRHRHDARTRKTRQRRPR